MSNFPVYRAALDGSREVFSWGNCGWKSYEVHDHIVRTLSRGSAVLVAAQGIFDYIADTHAPQVREGGIAEIQFGQIKLDAIPSRPIFDNTWIEFQTPHIYEGALCSLVSKDKDGSEYNVSVICVSKADGDMVAYPVDFSMRFDADGLFEDYGSIRCDEFLELPFESSSAIERIAASAVPVVLVSFMFAHCKNVDLVERLPKRHEQREAKRRGEPILKYHEIVIDPNRSYATNATSASSDNKPSKALHIARGHFAHYTEEKPLFGKYAGTFWVPAHVRGRADNGMVQSTYKVKALQPV